MNVEIEGWALLREPDGRARFGPRQLPRYRELDDKAIAGIQSGVFANAKEAAKSLASLYRPNVWPDLSNSQRADYIKSKKKKYESMLKRLDPDA